jgi:hypothetical protein
VTCKHCAHCQRLEIAKKARALKMKLISAPGQINKPNPAKALKARLIAENRAKSTRGKKP